MAYIQDIRHFRNDQERAFCHWLLEKGYGRAPMLWHFDFSSGILTASEAIDRADAERTDIMLGWLKCLKEDKYAAGLHFNICKLLGTQACWLDRIYGLMQVELRSDRLVYEAFKRYWDAYVTQSENRNIVRQSMLAMIEGRALKTMKREVPYWKGAVKPDSCCGKPNSHHYDILTKMLVQQWCIYEQVEDNLPKELG